MKDEILKPMTLTNPKKMKIRSKIKKMLKTGKSFSNKKIDQMIKNEYDKFTGVDIVFALRNLGTFCDRCGKCCEDCEPIVIEAEDIQRISNYLGMTIWKTHAKFVTVDNDKFCLKYVKPCVFYESKRCKIYSARPSVCRLYPFNKTDFDNNTSTIDDFCHVMDNLLVFKVVGKLILEQLPEPLKKKMKQVSENIASTVEQANPESETQRMLLWAQEMQKQIIGV